MRSEVRRGRKFVEYHDDSRPVLCGLTLVLDYLNRATSRRLSYCGIGSRESWGTNFMEVTDAI